MSWLTKFTNLFARRRYEADMAEEMRAHLELREEQLRAQGHSPESARRAARIEFGGVEQLKERCRDGRALAWLDGLARDFRHGARQLARSPGFTLIAVLSLAVGIGASTAIFTLVNDFLLRSLPVRAPGELVLFRHVAGARGGPIFRAQEGQAYDDPKSGRRTGTSFSLPAYERFRELSPGLSAVFAFAPVEGNLLIDGRPELKPLAQVVSANYFDALGVGTVLGRTLRAEDHRPDAPAVGVISHRCWRARFQLDPAVVGRVVVFNRVPVTIVGVTPPGFDGAMQAGESADLTLALSQIARFDTESGAERAESWYWWLRVMGRLAPGATPGQARAALEPAFQQVAQAGWQAAQALEPGRSPEAMPDLPNLALDPGAHGENDTRREFAPALQLLLAFVALVLVAACANVANLLLARGVARRREVAVRLALGAGRARLIRQLLTESLLLAALATALGVALAWASRGPLLALQPFGSTPLHLDLPLDGRVLAFSVGLACVTTLLFGLAPALRATRVDLTNEFQGGSRALGSRGQSKLSRLLLALQVALSLILLVGTGLIQRTLWNLQSVEAGFDQRGLIGFRIEPGSAGLDPAASQALVGRVTERLERLPGVQGVTHSRIGLLSRGSTMRLITIDGYTPPPGAEPGVYSNDVAANFFEVMKMPILAGRGFAPNDAGGPTARVAVINQSLARKCFGGRNPIGETMRLGNASTPDAPRIEIVGVVRDAKYSTLREPIAPTFYLPASLRTSGRACYAVRVSGDATALPAVRNAVREIEPSLAVLALRTQQESLDLLHAQEILFARLLGFFGLVAVALACVGLHGLMSFAVSQRVAEIGLRLTLGATRGDVIALFLRESLGLVLAGVALGLGSAALLAKGLTATLYGLSPLDPATYAAAALLLLAVALLASTAPALRASWVDPARALREG